MSALSQCYAASEGWLVYSLVGHCLLQDVCSFSVTVWRVTTIRVWWVRGDFGSTILHASLDWAGGVHQKIKKTSPRPDETEASFIWSFHVVDLLTPNERLAQARLLLRC